MNAVTTIPAHIQKSINENNKVLDFIKDWQSKNEYNPKFLDEFNAKFNAEFNDFLKAGNFTAETIKFFTA
jgi:beta-glucanase (GH16 family)